MCSNNILNYRNIILLGMLYTIVRTSTSFILKQFLSLEQCTITLKSKQIYPQLALGLFKSAVRKMNKRVYRKKMFRKLKVNN